MRPLCLMLLFGTLAQASLIATLDAGTGFFPDSVHCSNRYTAPANAPSFDRACFANSPPLASAYSEVAAQGPMHIFLASTGGTTAAGCNPRGCAIGDAEIMYSDVWTVTGGTGNGLLVLDVNQTLVRGSQYPFITFTFQGQGYNGTYLILPFVYGQPFAFGYWADLSSFDQGYGSGTWSLDISPRFFENCDINPPFGCAHLTGTVNSEFGDPFATFAPAPQVIIPEPSTMDIIALLAGGTLLKMRRFGPLAAR